MAALVALDAGMGRKQRYTKVFAPRAHVADQCDREWRIRRTGLATDEYADAPHGDTLVVLNVNFAGVHGNCRFRVTTMIFADDEIRWHPDRSARMVHLNGAAHVVDLVAFDASFGRAEQQGRGGGRMVGASETA